MGSRRPMTDFDAGAVAPGGIPSFKPSVVRQRVLGVIERRPDAGGIFHREDEHDGDDRGEGRAIVENIESQ